MENDDSNSTRESIYYPELFPITLTHGEFPTNATVHDAMSMTYGLLVTPFIATDEGSSLLQYNPKLQSHRSAVARCEACGAYINPFCDSTSLRWICSLCDTRNSFSRHMLRYRQVDLRLLPEMQHLLLDYPLPLSSADDGGASNSRASPGTGVGANTKIDNGTKRQKTRADRRKEKLHSKYHCPANERPLVHVFLIQESMPLDCIQAAIDAVTQATSADPDTGLHPDIEVIILTFSNRIGIYRLHPDIKTKNGPNKTERDTTTTENGVNSTQSSTYLLPACIQYSHFSLDKVLRNKNASMQSPLSSDNTSSSEVNNGGVFDGQNSLQFLSLASPGQTLSANATQTQTETVDRICALLPMNEIASFDDVRVPIGEVRESALFDASPSVFSTAGEGCRAATWNTCFATLPQLSHPRRNGLILTKKYHFMLYAEAFLQPLFSLYTSSFA